MLPEPIGLGGVPPAGGVEHLFEQPVGRRRNGFPVNDRAAVKIDQVAEPFRHRRIGRHLDHGHDGISSGRPQAGGEQHHVYTRGHEPGHGFHVVARRTDEGQPGVRHGFRVIEHGADRGLAALLRRASRFDGIGDQPVVDVPGAGVVGDGSPASVGGGLIAAHQLKEARLVFLADAAGNHVGFHAAQLGEFRQSGPAAERHHAIRDFADGGVGRNAGKAVRAAALHPKLEFRERHGAALHQIGALEMRQRFADRLFHHLDFAGPILLPQQDAGLVETKVPLPQRLLKQPDLRLLAAKAEHGEPRHVGMVRVGGQHPA